MFGAHKYIFVFILFFVVVTPALAFNETDEQEEARNMYHIREFEVPQRPSKLDTGCTGICGVTSWPPNCCKRKRTLPRVSFHYYLIRMFSNREKHHFLNVYKYRELRVLCQESQISLISPPPVGRGGGGDTSRKFGWGCAAHCWKPSTYTFQIKICDFPNPISDLTQNSIPSFRPDPYPISFA